MRLILIFMTTIYLNANASLLYDVNKKQYTSIIESAIQLLPKELLSSLQGDKKLKFVITNRFLFGGIGQAVPSLNLIRLSQSYMDSGADEIELTRNIIHELGHLYYSKKRDKILTPYYNLLSGNTRNGFLLKRLRSRNMDYESSLDSYEYTNKVEFFAVNLEYFLTLEEYKCRRPLQYSYFMKLLNHKPFPSYSCLLPSKFILTSKSNKTIKELDFNKLYEVHYLVAGKGQAKESTFGHSMLRLVFCSPKRQRMSEKCYKDYAYHYVISFRAEVFNSTLYILKGLTGQYRSKLFLSRFVDTLKEYTSDEARELVSYPLELTKQELNKTKTILLDQQFSYYGKYKYITNNCATETLNFLQLLLKNERIFKIHSKTPFLMAKQLLINDLAMLDPLDDKEYYSHIGLYFMPTIKNNEEELKNLQRYLKVKDLNNFDSLLFREKLDALNVSEEDDIAFFASFYKQQKLQLEKHEGYLSNIFFESILKSNSKSKLKAELLSFMFPDKGLKGVPLAQEFEQIQERLMLPLLTKYFSDYLKRAPSIKKKLIEYKELIKLAKKKLNMNFQNTHPRRL